MKVAILGLGPSIKLFNPLDYQMSIGVNDIWRYHPCEAIVCLNKQSEFNHDRITVINNSKPKAFYSQIANWSIRSDFVKIELTPYFPNKPIDLTIPQIHKSYCSPFVACQIAIKYYRATEIHLFGVDMINHPHLDQGYCTKIKSHFALLAVALRENVCNLIVHGSGILKDI